MVTLIPFSHWNFTVNSIIYQFDCYGVILQMRNECFEIYYIIIISLLNQVLSRGFVLDCKKKLFLLYIGLSSLLKNLTTYLSNLHYYVLIIGGAHSITVIIVEDGHGSNPGLGCLHFT